MQRGRKSAASAVVGFVPVDGRSPLLRPPASLSDAERSIWVHVVTAVRPEHFKLGDEPLLSRYCETVVMCDLTGKLLLPTLPGADHRRICQRRNGC